MDAKRIVEQIDSAIELLNSLRAEVMQVQPQGDADILRKMEEEAEAGICHNCKEPLGDGKETRGVHERCMQAIRRECERKKLPLSYFMTAGRLGPPAKPGRKSKYDYQDVLAVQAAATAQSTEDAKTSRKKPPRKGAAK